MRVEATQQALLGHTGNPPHGEGSGGAGNAGRVVIRFAP